MILKDMFLFTVFMGTLMLVITSIGANTYDLRAIKASKELARHPRSRKYLSRPLVSVLILSSDSDSTIEQCIRSVFKSTYRKIELIVVDTASTDATKSIVKKMIEEFPRKSLRLVSRRNATINNPVLKNSTKHVHGELVLLLGAGNYIDKNAVRRAVTHFNHDRTITTLTSKQDTAINYSSGGLFLAYTSQLHYRLKKFLTITKADYDAPVVGSFQRRDIFQKLTASLVFNPRQELVETRKREDMSTFYASDVIIYTQAGLSFLRFLQQRITSRQYGLPFFLNYTLRRPSKAKYGHIISALYLLTVLCVGVLFVCIPVLLTYFIYMALGLHEPSLLLLSWSVLEIILIISIWSDAQMQLSRKLALSFCAPITFVVFYILSLIQLLVTLRNTVWVYRQKSTPEYSLQLR